ncbi:MAG: hypothetical protein ACPGU1_14330 [Myxococcota bacterium]
MLTLKRLLLLLAITSFAMMTSACIANPTPHPGSGDNTGLNAPSDPTMGGSGASEAPSTAASAQDDGAESGNAVGGSEPNTGSADTSSESDAAPSEDTAAGPDAEDDDAQGDDAQDDDAQGDDAQDDDAQGDDAQGDDTADVTWGAVCTVDLDCDAPADLCVLQPGASEGYCSVACPNLGADCTYDDWTCNVVGTCEAPMATWCGPPSEVAEGGGFIVACE